MDMTTKVSFLPTRNVNTPMVNNPINDNMLLNIVSSEPFHNITCINYYKYKRNECNLSLDLYRLSFL